MALVEEYHRRAGILLPEPKLHAAIHAIVEQQLAGGLPQVTTAMTRLLSQGLDRHEGIHAIGAVLAEHMRQLMNEELAADDPNAAYFAAVEHLSAESWRREFGADEHAV